MAKPPSPMALVKRTRAEALAFAEKAGHANVLKLLAKAQKELEQRLLQTHGLVHAAGEPFSVVRMQLVLKQVQAVTKALTAAMKGTLTDSGRTVAGKAAKDTADFMQTAEKRFRGISAVLPINVASMMSRAVSGSGPAFSLATGLKQSPSSRSDCNLGWCRASGGKKCVTISPSRASSCKVHRSTGPSALFARKHFIATIVLLTSR